MMLTCIYYLLHLNCRRCVPNITGSQLSLDDAQVVITIGNECTALLSGALEVALALVNGPTPSTTPGGWSGGWPAIAAQQRGAWPSHFGGAVPAASTPAAGTAAITAGTPAAAAAAAAVEAAGGGGAVALPGNPQLPESLAAVCSLLAHRKFACLFVDRGGVRALLALPKVGSIAKQHSADIECVPRYCPPPPPPYLLPPPYPPPALPPTPLQTESSLQNEHSPRKIVQSRLEYFFATSLL
jgi:hypothetical protein